jgi:hypothetical protein
LIQFIKQEVSKSIIAAIKTVTQNKLLGFSKRIILGERLRLFPFEALEIRNVESYLQVLQDSS